MKKSFLIAACSLACMALSAQAQVGLGGGVVGTLGANGAASSVGSLGSGISSGATMRGTDLRNSGQIGSNAQTPSAAAGASNAIDARANGNGIRVDGTARGSASTTAPIVSGSTWGAQANTQASTPDVQGVKDSAKSEVKNTVNGLEERRDRIEQRTDKAADKAIDKL